MSHDNRIAFSMERELECTRYFDNQIIAAFTREVKQTPHALPAQFHIGLLWEIVLVASH